MAQVHLIATIIVPEKVDQDEIARQIEKFGMELYRARPRSRHGDGCTVTEGWFGGPSTVGIVLSAVAHEGEISHSRLFEVMRKWRRGLLAETLRCRAATLAKEALGNGNSTTFSAWVETRKRKEPTVHGDVTVEPEKAREAA